VSSAAASQGLHVVSLHFRLPMSSPDSSILSAAYRFYTKIGDSTGGPDHLSFFAPSDQLSYLNNCFDLLSFSSPQLDSIRRCHFIAPLIPVPVIPKSVYFRPSLCRCPIDRFCASVFISLYLLPSARFPSCRLSCSSPPRSESLHPVPYVHMYVILSACRVDHISTPLEQTWAV